MEATCYPELRWCGYPVTLSRTELSGVIRTWRDPAPIEREELRPYARDPGMLADEVDRLERLHEEADPGCRPYFLFTDVQEELHRALAPGGGA